VFSPLCADVKPTPSSSAGGRRVDSYSVTCALKRGGQGGGAARVTLLCRRHSPLDQLSATADAEAGAAAAAAATTH